ncbi:MAG: hypothetical protein ABIP29_08155 [Candidatus Eisenbacteria bacterium]
MACAVLAFLAIAAGCSTDRIDPPEGVDERDLEVSVAIDSSSTWARRARDAWAAGDTTRAGEADELARATFSAIWVDRQAQVAEAERVRDSEHLPSAVAIMPPSAEEMASALAGLGLAADIVAAEGPAPLWQVVLRDPTGGAGAATEFWAWPDPEQPLGPPVLQPVPAGAPARRRYGPEAVGALATFARSDGTGLASAWTRPRGRGGLEIALLRRGKFGTKAGQTWRVATTRLLSIVADSIAFIPVTEGDQAPSLLVRGAGGRDPLFDSCPGCPHLERSQRYLFEGTTWTLREERTEPTPYAAIVSFMHALHEGGTEAAIPYASGPEVIEQVKELGLERGPMGLLRAAPGTSAMDRTQRYRRGGTVGSDGLEITVDPRGAGWVVADLRPTRLVIE